MMKFLSLLLALLVYISSCLNDSAAADDCGASDVPNFTGAKVLDANDGYKVSWALKDDELYLKLEMNAANSKGFMGFGLGEQTSGSMLGADIVTVRLSNGKVVVEDRNVPFDSNPIDNYSPDFPSVDHCQDWIPVTAETTATSWSAVVKRKVKTGDSQDRDVITDGPQRIIFAWSKTANIVQYHGSRRGTSAIRFSASTNQVPIPSDTAVSVNLTMDKFAVPTQYDTYYICKGFDMTQIVDLSGGDRHIVRIDPLIQPGNEKYVHHFLVHVCGDKVAYPFSYHLPDQQPATCLRDGNGNSPLVVGSCKSLYYAWAVGGTEFMLPDDVGLRIGNDTQNLAMKYLILEIHYDNPGLQQGIVDSSGITVHITDKGALRKHDAAVLILGLFGSGSDLVANTPNQHWESTCSSTCTNKFTGSVNVFGSFLHMHSWGQQIWTSHYPGGNMADKHIRNRIDFWNFAFQQITPYEFTIAKGDKLSTHGVYDLTQSDYNVPLGEKSNQEMLFDFLYVYPAKNLNGVYNCGTVGKFSISWCGGGYISEKSPAPDGDKSLPYTFGPESATCSASESTPTKGVCVPTQSPTKSNSTSAPTTTSSPTEQTQITLSPTSSPSKGISPTTSSPSVKPSTAKPSQKPKATRKPTNAPTFKPTKPPTLKPTLKPSKLPTTKPTSRSPTTKPTKSPKSKPTTST